MDGGELVTWNARGARRKKKAAHEPWSGSCEALFFAAGSGIYMGRHRFSFDSKNLPG